MFFDREWSKARGPKRSKVVVVVGQKSKYDIFFTEVNKFDTSGIQRM